MYGLVFLVALLATVNAQCPGTGGIVVSGQCWYISLFASFPGCDAFCASIGAQADSNEILNIAGSFASSNAGCQAVVTGFGFAATVQAVTGAACDNSGLGCFFNVGQSLRCVSPSTTTSATASFPAGGRYCACDVAASSGFTDPHFSGFNGEQLDIKHDNKAANKYFNIFCKENVAINALFSPNTEELLYMTEFVAKFGQFEMELNVEGFIPSGKFSKDGEKIVFENGSAVVQDGDVTVKYGPFTYHFISAVENGEGYLDMYVQGPRRGQSAEGIVGRTLSRVFSEEEFSAYMQYVRSDANEFSCPL